jgi:hypothetical protein
MELRLVVESESDKLADIVVHATTLSVSPERLSEFGDIPDLDASLLNLREVDLLGNADRLIDTLLTILLGVKTVLHESLTELAFAVSLRPKVTKHTIH